MLGYMKRLMVAALVSVVLVVCGATAARGQKDSVDEGHPAVREFAARMASIGSMAAELKMDGLEIYSDGKSRWQFMPEDKEVTVTALSDVASSPFDRPMQLFQEYDKLFKVRYRGEHVKDGVRYLDFTFYPRDLRQPYTQIHVSVIATSYIPYKLTYMGKDGVSYLLTLKNFKRNAPVRSNFAFDPKGVKGIEIIDLR